MIIIFDLDYTLLDAAKFKNGLAKVLGLSRKEFNLSYKKHFKNKKINYNPERHLLILEKEGKKLPLNAKKRVVCFLRNINKFLFSGAEEKIRKLGKKNFLILLTLGDKSWQARKMKNLKIKKYFDKIILVDKHKTGALKFLKNKKDKILVVNDKAKETKEILKMINAKTFLIKGPYSKNIKHKFEIHKSIGQLKVE
ncbi:HAD family hydrolase [Candidatus Falkowbacteria bacterium]|nr:HAD family hydrolase [Candidatus Falkowbacteria bacterium]